MTRYPEQRTARLEVRLTPSEKRTIIAHSRRKGYVSASDYMRGLFVLDSHADVLPPVLTIHPTASCEGDATTDKE